MGTRLVSLDVTSTANMDLFAALIPDGRYSVRPRLRNASISVGNDCTLIINGEPVRIKAQFGLNAIEELRIRSLEIVESGVQIYMLASY